MKTLKLAVAVVSLTCLNAIADIQVNFDGLLHHASLAAIGAATGYVVKKQLALYARNSVESKTLGKVGYAGQALVVSGVTLGTAAGALATISGDKKGALCHSSCVATLAAVTTFVATQTLDEEDDLVQAYAAATAKP